MIDPSSRLGRELKAAEDFFELAKSASSPFLQAYYRRVAERFLSSQGELHRARTPPPTCRSLSSGRHCRHARRRPRICFLCLLEERAGQQKASQ